MGTYICESCGGPIPKAKLRQSKPNRFCCWACYKASPRSGQRVTTTKGSRVLRMPDHPIAPPSGLIALCRVVLYEKIGPGPHPCEWCGLAIRWTPGKRPTRGSIVADHLDWNVHNNVPENLVASCLVCNSHRVRDHDRRLIRSDEVFLIDARGERHRAMEQACEECAAPFLARLTWVKAGRNPRFCSLPCANRATSRNRVKPSSSPPS